eukprot:9062728-Lingulodinium_polyedra.AAC.1
MHKRRAINVSVGRREQATNMYLCQPRKQNSWPVVMGVLPKEYPALFHEDNDAMIRVIKTGRNPTMRYLHRARRNSIAVLHDILNGHGNLDKKVDIKYTPSCDMAADIFTKGFTDKVKWIHAIRAIGIAKTSKIGKRQ